MREIDLGVIRAEGKNGLYRMAVKMAARRYAKSDQLPQKVEDFVLDEIIPSVLDGKKRSLSQDSNVFLKPYEPSVVFEENIPKTGPVLFVANHWQEGPIKGKWTHFLIAKEVGKNREGPTNEIRWIMNGNLNVLVSGIKIPFSHEFLLKIADTYSQHVIGRNGRVDGGLSIIHSFKQGDPIGLYPEAEPSTNLKRGNPNAGFIAHALARTKPNAVVCPIGLYSRGIELHATFGEPFSMTKILERSYPLPVDSVKKEAVCQRVADYLMKKINPLVPMPHQLREIN